MKLVIALAAILAVSYAASENSDAVVLKSELDNIGIDGYNFAYETSNGIAAQEQAQLQNVGSENEAISVRGQYQYVGPDGVTYSVQYIADENGFQPQGGHLPVAP